MKLARNKMTMTRQERQQKVDAIIESIRKLIPKDWQAHEGFFMSLSGASSPVMVMISRAGIQDGLRKVSKEQQAEWRKQWRIDCQTQAATICATLKQAGYNASLDAGNSNSTLNVKLPNDLRG